MVAADTLEVAALISEALAYLAGAGQVPGEVESGSVDRASHFRPNTFRPSVRGTASLHSGCISLE